MALTVCLLVWTAELQEAVKGGEQALAEQCSRQGTDIQELVALLEEDRPPLVRAAVRSVIVQDLHLLDVTRQVFIILLLHLILHVHQSFCHKLRSNLISLAPAPAAGAQEEDLL